MAIVEILTDSTICYLEDDIVLSKTGDLLLYAGRNMSRYVREVGRDPKEFETRSGLRRITEMNFGLEELKSEENLVDGEPNDNLLTYHVSPSTYKTELMRFEPKRLRFKKMVNKSLDKLTIRVTDQNGKLIDYGVSSTIVLQIV